MFPLLVAVGGVFFLAVDVEDYFFLDWAWNDVT